MANDAPVCPNLLDLGVARSSAIKDAADLRTECQEPVYVSMRWVLGSS